MPTIEELKNSKVDSSIENKNSNLRKLLLEDTLDVAPIGLTFCFDRESFLNVSVFFKLLLNTFVCCVKIDFEIFQFNPDSDAYAYYETIVC
ncbi:unnamed protein product [Schistosoma margrebowiei]|uniref:Uncharacterized protein n=1 Tax=Schistosoma margrebowiei TaxID=48269 RepID=A0A183M3U8_9TREM|nr:unnamed protein product [Schistosoma margrebowiei]